MTDCLIVGAGSSKDKAHSFDDIYTISSNLHFPYANCIFAQDDPILDQILRKNIEGFTTQPVFTTPQKWKKYKDYSRCLPFDYRHFYNCGSLSSGLNAIVLAQFFAFKRIFLAGFNFDEKPDLDYDVKFDTIRGDKVRYEFL